VKLSRLLAVTCLALLPLGAAVSEDAAPARDTEGWTPLFNGRDLSGWETWLGKPHKTVELPGLPKNEKGEYTEPVGLDRDPRQVFTVVDVDGRPAIRISGEVWGALTTKAEYGDYHLRFEFKWGAKRWPPRDQTVRDSGGLYHCVGPHGAGSGFWMRSFEIQVQEGDCGDFHSVDGVLVDVEAERKDPADPKSLLVYRRGAPKVVGHKQRIVKDPDNEKPTGEWNTLEVYCLGQTSVHVVNGKVNMVLTGLRQVVDGREVPLTRGRIQFQSESAEVFYREIAVRPIEEIPKAVLP